MADVIEIKAKCTFCWRDAVEKWPDIPNLPGEGSPTCWEHCGRNKGGHHEADEKMFNVLVEENNQQVPQVLVDVECRHCGQSGSFMLDLTQQEIQWG